MGEIINYGINWVFERPIIQLRNLANSVIGLKIWWLERSGAGEGSITQLLAKPGSIQPGSAKKVFLQLGVRFDPIESNFEGGFSDERRLNPTKLE